MTTAYKFEDHEIQKIPKRARIHAYLKEGKIKFIDIEIKGSVDDERTNQSFKVVLTEKSKRISFLVPKKNYPDLYDCYNVQKQLIKEFFVCKICHDTFSNSGGNASRHSMQHCNQILNHREEILKRIRLFIYDTAQPFSIVENESFRNLFDFKLLSVETFHNYMKLDYQNLIRCIQEEIDRANLVAIILDEWSSSKDSFIGLTAYLTGEKVQNDSIVLALSVPNEFDRTSKTVSKELSAKLSYYNFNNKIIASVTDCASVMKKTMEIMHIDWSPCLSHNVHNAIKKCLVKSRVFQLR